MTAVAVDGGSLAEAQIAPGLHVASGWIGLASTTPERGVMPAAMAGLNVIADKSTERRNIVLCNLLCDGIRMYTSRIRSDVTDAGKQARSFAQLLIPSGEESASPQPFPLIYYF